MRLAVLAPDRLPRQLATEVLADEPDLEVVLSGADVGDVRRAVEDRAVDAVVVLARAGDALALDTLGALEAFPAVRTVLAWCSRAAPLRCPPPDVAVGPEEALAALLRALRSVEARPDRVAVLSPPPASASRTRRSLTEREVEVLRLVASGMTAGQVAEQMGITARSVENHKRRIFAKLDVQSQTQAVARALRTGLIAAGRPSPGSGRGGR